MRNSKKMKKKQKQNNTKKLRNLTIKSNRLNLLLFSLAFCKFLLSLQRITFIPTFILLGIDVVPNTGLYRLHKKIPAI